MTVICTKCKKIIGNKQFLTCNLCKYNFHLECTEVTFQRYRIMTTANKKAYKCMACSSRMQIQNASTPNSIGSTSSPASSCFTFQESDNITQRNKQRINVPTENSFQELTTEEAEFGSPASSPLTQKNRSYSELQSTGTYLIEDLQDKIRTLKEKLEIAENEIENLLTTNNELTKLNSKYELRIKQLSHICKSSSKSNTNVRNKDTSVKYKQNLSTSQLEISESQKVLNSNIASTPSSGILERQHNKNHNEFKQISTEGLERPTVKASKLDRNKHIYIIGDESLRGLAAELSSTRSGRWNDVYTPYAHIMSGATSSEILEHCNNVESKLTCNDIVILGLGSHDKDINKLHANICIAISKFNKALVLLVPVNSNPYLNENMLNNNMRLWTKHFVNCKIIDMSIFCNNYNYDMNYIVTLCSKINVFIDYRQYEQQFLSINSIKNHLRISSTNIRIKNNSDVIPRKDKITYYFKPIGNKNVVKSNKDHSNQENISVQNKTFFRE